ncbi:uncharacterized protein LOC106665355 [Cimex lectularius]|uniref:Uncharacterized protein n=1 Tax=Cimex lectularius TaxID=79782 RepID=A0A8I6RKN5_CIMLE|nr:uncharacterized protein LOC106665355 [Cimex lectularius]
MSSKSTPVVRNMKMKVQKVLVYEPVKADKKIMKCLPVPPGGRGIKLCEYRQMNRSCFPKLCDCPLREQPLSRRSMFFRKACFTVKIMALAVMLKITYDAGFWSHPGNSKKLVEKISETLNLKGQRDRQIVEPSKPSKNIDEDYENEPHNISNIWNGIILTCARNLLQLDPSRQ